MVNACNTTSADYTAGIELLFNLSPDLLCISSADGCIIKANHAFIHALGYNEDELLFKKFINFIHPADKETTLQQFESLIRNETVLLFRNRFRCFNGQYKWLSWNANQLPDETIYASARDVSEIVKTTKIKQQAEEKVRLINERYRLVTAATKDVIWDWNLKTDKLKWGKSFETNFGYKFDNKSGKFNTWADHIHPDDRDRILTDINLAIDNAETKFWSREYRYLRADHSVAFIIDQGYIIRNDDVKAIRMVGAMQDITELKEKEVRIRKQNEQLMEIAQINSHEIRRPVASILGLMQLIDKEDIRNQATWELLDLLEATTLELDSIIRRIIDKTCD